jgi:hypothetical protein
MDQQQKFKKSGLSTSPQCHRCEEVETMEHLIYLCPSYAEKLWVEFGLALTQTIMQFTNEYTARIELTPKKSSIINLTQPFYLGYRTN